MLLIIERLLNCINHLKQMLASRIVSTSSENTDTSKNVDKVVKQATSKQRNNLI